MKMCVFLMVCLLICSGCRTFIKSSESTDLAVLTRGYQSPYITPRSNDYMVAEYCFIVSDSIHDKTLDEINSVIQRYETEGLIPSEPSIAEFYAYRSYCYAHHSPKYGGTRHFMNATLAEAEVAHYGRAITGIAFWVPIALIADTIYYPYQYYQCLTVSESEIKQALLDLKKARELADEDDDIIILEHITATPLDEIYD